jgi:hypothetical protein
VHIVTFLACTFSYWQQSVFLIVDRSSVRTEEA